jgi:hypothetical protein
MAWDLAPSLKTLRNQVNAAAPKRNKASDGTIGDAAHAKTKSDHNPNPQGIVCALDLTHDPANGFDADAFAETQRKNPHPDLKYMVWKGRIASRKYNWTWRPSSGHFNHIHVSVGVGTDGQSAPGTYNNTSPWNLGGTPMSADKLTKEEVIELHVAYYGGPPGSGYDYRHVGGTLNALIHAFKPSGETLVNKVNNKKLIKPSECPVVQAPSTECKCECNVEAIAEAVLKRQKEQFNK